MRRRRELRAASRGGEGREGGRGGGVVSRRPAWVCLNTIVLPRAICSQGRPTPVSDFDSPQKGQKQLPGVSTTL